MIRFELLFRRVLADLSAAILLLILVISVYCALLHDASISRAESFLFYFYSPLLMVAYFLWIGDLSRGSVFWLKVAGLSVLVGVVFLLLDLFFGILFQKHDNLLDALTGNGVSFGITLIIFPGVTFIAISGWLRQKILNHSGRGH